MSNIKKKKDMNILEVFGDNVSVTDQEENLQIVNYKQCDNDSPEELKKARGVVQEVDTGNILFETFPYTDELVAGDPAVKEINREEWDVFYSMEGSLLRVFWYKTRWYISTNKKLNGFKSRWSSRKSFGEMFRESLVAASADENALESFLDSLDKEYVYFFLVRYNNENRVVCQPAKNSKDQVVFISRWHSETKEYDRVWTNGATIQMANPVVGADDIDEFARNVDITKYQGVILFHKTQNRQVKVISPEYAELSKVRNNNPNLRFRYLEVRLNPVMKQKIIELYPIYQDMFLEYENIIYQIAKLVRYYYIQRYIKNKYVTLPKDEYVLMKKCHDWYLLNREKNRINVSKVMEIMNQEDVLSLYKMIRRFQINQHSITRNTGYREEEHQQQPGANIEMMEFYHIPVA